MDNIKTTVETISLVLAIAKMSWRIGSFWRSKRKQKSYSTCMRSRMATTCDISSTRIFLVRS